MNGTAVVIPVYKANPGRTELAAIKQAGKVLHKHPIFLATFRELNLGAYSVLGEFNVVYLDKSYFSSVKGYNKLITSISFFRPFLAFEYLLIYHTDAWVFEDRLEHWCSMGYDYVGAPLLEKRENKPEFVQGANGGLSLRKISSHIKVLKSIKPVKAWSEVYDARLGNRGLLKKLRNLPGALKDYLIDNNSHYLLHTIRQHEDRFWSCQVPQTFKDFKVCGPEKSAFFAFERYPSYLFAEITKGKLPFGCHNWEKWGPEFWKRFIPLEQGNG